MVLRPHDTRVAKQNATVVRFASDLIIPTIAAANNNPAFAKLNISDPARVSRPRVGRRPRP
jgi:hypothetical protein